MNATSPRQERDILQDAAAVFLELDRLHSAARALETSLEVLRTEYGVATLRWGWAPDQLRLACTDQGLLP